MKWVQTPSSTIRPFTYGFRYLWPGYPSDLVGPACSQQRGLLLGHFYIQYVA